MDAAERFYGRPCVSVAGSRRVSTEIARALPRLRGLRARSALTDADRGVIFEAAAMAAAGLKVRLGLGDGALADPALTEVVARALAEHDAPANRLAFSIADTHLGIDGDERGVGDRLAGLGCELSLERFSCGYGAFTFLKAKPISYLSLDGGGSVGQTAAANQQTATAIVNLARDLGIRTIARGIDDDDAMRRARLLDVDLVVGDFIGPVEALTWRSHNRAALLAGPPVQRAPESVLGLLRRALDEDGFVARFEPTADLATGRTLGHELTLEVWEPGGHRTQWETLLAVAERFGLSTQLDDRLIGHAVALAASGATVALDISTASLADPDLSHRVEQTVVHARVDPALLTFELRAEGMRSSPVAATAFAHRIHALGCGIAVDHVGPGVGDLAFLKRLPVDALKMDAGLTSGPHWTEADRNVVRAVAQLAHGLGMTVGAQGISDPEARHHLLDLDVDRGQGPLFGVPAALGAGTDAAEHLAAPADHGS